MMSNNTDQKDAHVSIAIALTASPTTTPTLHSTKTLKSSHSHPDTDFNTVEDPSSNTTITTAPLPALPQALHLNTSHTGGIISNTVGRHHRSNSLAFQEVDIASLHASTSDGGFSDPLTDPSFFNTTLRHSSGSPTASSNGFVLESPTMFSTPYEFEMQRFNAYDGSEPSTVKVVTTIIPAAASKPSTTTTTGSSFFTGWMAVPPSLAGRPKLSQDQEDYIRKEYERGPVPLMWAKNDDLENQVASSTAKVTPEAATSSSWFGNWGFRSSSATSTKGASITTPPKAAVAPTPSDSCRRETSQAL
ncbi:hypothetical protein BG015_010627 [Linnemannia schmuckeri]|uniref:Uncharacterized protein n=1 Tax=Linnemannia schmuckeri TaxID=64567 RepID=A0A9P5RU85_9FUNG|nr:hypothetical protein BG015_010627 [Linnemannia schmuckeri]